MPEWLKGADCKSVGLRLRWFESSLLHQAFSRVRAAARSQKKAAARNFGARFSAGVAQLVELLPSKQNVASSSLVSRSIVTRFNGAQVELSKERSVRRPQRSVQCTAQTFAGRPCGSVVEHSLGKGEVARSIRAMGTIGFVSGKRPALPSFSEF